MDSVGLMFTKYYEYDGDLTQYRSLSHEEYFIIILQFRGEGVEWS